MKIGCISWSHRNEFGAGKMDVFSWMEHCKKDCKLDGVEIWNNHFESLEEEYLGKIKETSKALDLPVYSVATKCIFGQFSENEVREAQDTMRRWLEVAHFLEAPVLRISIGCENVRLEEHQKKVFRALSDVIKERKYPEISVGIENQEPGIVQNVMDAELMRRESGGLLKVVLDNGSFLDKEDSYEFMEKTLSEAAVVHVKFFDIREDGSDRCIDYKKVKEILTKSSYRGYLSIEYDSMEPAERDVPRIARYLRKLFEEVE